MAEATIGIIVNGATGRIGSTQHLANCLVPIRNEGGLELAGRLVIPRLILVGRDEQRLAAIARHHSIAEWSCDLDTVLADPDFPVFFDSAATHLRLATLTKAIDAGKHVYTEKPMAPGLAEARGLIAAAEQKGLCHGAVEDKHNLPGLARLAHLVRQGFFGRIHHFRLEFGWWVFDGRHVPCQRPSWNYRASGGGGMIFDMHPHWRYVIERILGPIARVVATAWTAIPERIDEAGRAYAVDVEDSTSALVELEQGAQGMIHSSWATRVRRDEVLSLHVDGSEGSAVAGPHRCVIQPMAATPSVKWNAERDLGTDHRAEWLAAPDLLPVKNSYRVGWEGFLRHVVTGAPFDATFRAGLRDIQLAEACHASIAERRWVDLPRIAA